MEVGELAKLQTQKQALKKQRQSLIQSEIKKRQKSRINLDQSSVKKGYIEKHKYIAKKQFETIVQKSRKIPIQIQDNVNPNTYLTRSTHFVNILQRTKAKVKFDKQIFETNLKAINSFGVTNKQYLISFTLHFQKEIVCEPRPFLVLLPVPQPCQQVIIVLQQVKQKEQGQYSFESIKQMNLKVMSSSEFIQKINNDKIFLKKIHQQQIKCFIKFQLFKRKKFYQKLLKKGTIIFPIDSKKVPFCLQQHINNFPDYVQYMAQHFLTVAKTGQQHSFRIRTGNVQNIVNNSIAIIYQLTAKLLERSKVKQNKLIKVTAKTASSINFDLYTAE